MSTSSTSASDLLGPQGPFAEHLPGFAPRHQQQALAQAIDDVLFHGEHLIGEAGTGVGKTFAYLVPSILSGLKVIVSTGTRHLQDQLYQSDVPLVRRALHSDCKVALLKGRNNYLCQHRLAQAVGHPAVSSTALLEQLTQVQEWAKCTQTGDISEVAELPENAEIWRYVTSDTDLCSAHEPEELDGCFIHRARKKAQSADLVIVNHHLFFADLALKDEGFGEILPSADAFILDEAHQIPDIASQFFGRRVSSRQLSDLVRSCTIEQRSTAKDMSELAAAIDGLEKSSRQFRLMLGVQTRRDAWQSVAHQQTVTQALIALQDAYDALCEQLELAAARSKGLANCLRRCQTQIDVLTQFADDLSAQNAWIKWFETFRTGYVLSLTPLSISQPFQRAVAMLNSSWVFTSATLSVNNSFDHFRQQLGIQEANECQQNSPFDFQQNALIYFPPRMPEPRESHYNQCVLEAALPVLEASQGRAFILFTSYRALNFAAEWLSNRLDMPLLVQGELPKRELIRAFQAQGNAVLLGTSSFWEGVDVRGQALSCVIIDKLPFASPSDPIMQARIEALRDGGGNPFFDYQLPQAAVTLKQGVGRLIRDVEDKGVIVLCDPRISVKPYGRLFLNSLPAIPDTSSIGVVEQFFAGI